MSWPTASLKEESYLITKGTTPTTLSQSFTGQGVPFLRAQNLVGGTVSIDTDPLYISKDTHEILGRSKIKPLDILISIAGTIGRAAIVPENAEEMNCNQAVAIVRPSPRIDRRFLLHWLSSPDAFSQMAKSKVTGTISNLSLGQIGKLKIPLPPLAEQRRIAAILDQADALRRARRRAIERLNDLGQAIFYEMFGDANDSSFGELVPLTEFFNFRTGKLDSNAATPDGKYPFFTCSREDFLIDEYAFDCEALLLAGNNATADYSVKHYDGKFNAYQRTYVITLVDERCSYFYAKFALQRKLNKLKYASKGSNTKYLTMTIFREMKILMPPVTKQQAFEERVKVLEATTLIHQRAAKTLDDLFSSLQQRAFRGDL
jgi:type I restriction enzyme S subunit